MQNGYSEQKLLSKIFWLIFQNLDLKKQNDQKIIGFVIFLQARE